MRHWIVFIFAIFVAVFALDLRAAESTPAPISPAQISPAPREVTVANNNSGNVPIATSLLAPTADAISQRPTVRMVGTTLLVDGVPTGMRAIEYRGEPLVELKKLGFNAVAMSTRPTPSVLQEARVCGLWIIASPPSPAELSNPRGSGFDAVPLTDPLYDRVLFWNLGEGLVKGDLATYAQWSAQLRSVCPDRFLMGQPESGIWDFSRLVDVVLIGRAPILTTQSLENYSRWQQEVPRLVRPDTPIWGTIQTQPDPHLISQWQLFGVPASETAALTYEQVQLLVHLAIGAGCHGLVFQSNTPLLGSDPDTEYRRRVLELVNHELMLVEEWFSRGDPVDTISPTTSGTQMAIVKTPRSRLLIPTTAPLETQYDLGPAPPGEARYIVPGVPDTYSAYQLLPGDIGGLRTQRIAGGMEIVLEESTSQSLVFFTEDPTVLTTATQRSRQLGQRMAQLAYELATRRVDSFEKTYEQLRQMQVSRAIPTVGQIPILTLPEQESLIASTRRWAELCAEFYASRQNASAYTQAERATRGVRLVERDIRREATRYDLNNSMLPTSVSFGTMPAYLAWRNRAQGGAREANRLPSGDAESAVAWQQNGWSVEEHKTAGVATFAQIVPRAAHSGRGGVELLVHETEPKSMPALFETAPMWITSPPVPVRLGEVLCISFWANIPEPLHGTQDGLIVMDTLGGEALAVRVGATNGWQEFAVYRVPPFNGHCKLIIAVGGGGRVWIDDIAITGVSYLTPPTPQTPSPSQPNPWQRLNPLQYLPAMPNMPNIPTPWRGGNSSETK
ncbi:MAG: hypothetical protein ACRC46_10215 [Thermoguttaceae bacterium]